MKSCCFSNLDSTVEATDQCGMILRGLRALQYAKSLPEENGTAPDAAQTVARTAAAHRFFTVVFMFRMT